MQRRECPKLLGDQQRGVIRQHDPSRPDANRRRARRHVRDDHGCRRARHAWDVVMLREPEAREPQAFAMLRQVERVAERLRRVAALHDR